MCFKTTIFFVVSTRKTQLGAVIPVNNLTIANSAKVNHFCLSKALESTVVFAKCETLE
jgi:hypothetical protein